MNITHLGHSTLLIESDSGRVLIDPGVFSDDWHGLDGLDAVLLTHAHPDHYDPENVPALMKKNPQARVLSEGELASNGAKDVADEAISVNTTYGLGAFTMRAVGGKHAVIHDDIPRIGNVGIILEDSAGTTLYHPGDAIDTPVENVDMLAVPVAAPWCAMKETISFMRACQAKQWMPIHDAILSGNGRGIFMKQLTDLGNKDVHDPAGSNEAFKLTKQ